MINYFLPNKEFLYIHKPSDDTIFYFPLTGITISKALKIGKCEIIPKNLLTSDVHLPKIMTNNISCVMKVNVDCISNNWRNNSDNYSIALQLSKQSIGALYLSIYNTKSRSDDNRRIVISNIGKHEVDEGLVVYTSGNIPKNIRDVSDHLFFTDNDLSEDLLNNLEKISDHMIGYYQNDNQYGNKILKALEIIYCCNNEIYSNERILKICAALNMIFRVNDTGKEIDSPQIASKLTQIFNYHKIDIKNKIPHDLQNKEFCNTKYNDLFVNEYKKVRNNFLHGIIDVYKEFTVIYILQNLLYAVSLYELLNIMILHQDYQSLNTTQDFNNKIQSIIDSYKKNKS